MKETQKTEKVVKTFEQFKNELKELATTDKELYTKILLNKVWTKWAIDGDFVKTFNNLENEYEYDEYHCRIIDTTNLPVSIIKTIEEIKLDPVPPINVKLRKYINEQIEEFINFSGIEIGENYTKEKFLKYLTEAKAIDKNLWNQMLNFDDGSFKEDFKKLRAK
ncbi:MAG: hypothetical protein ACRC4M_04235 [Mycoplasma sp.]